MHDTDVRLITVHEAARLLSCSVRKVYELLSMGELRRIHPPYAPGSTRLLYAQVRSYILKFSEGSNGSIS